MITITVSVFNAHIYNFFLKAERFSYCGLIKSNDLVPSSQQSLDMNVYFVNYSFALTTHWLSWRYPGRLYRAFKNDAFSTLVSKTADIKMLKLVICVLQEAPRDVKRLTVRIFMAMPRIASLEEIVSTLEEPCDISTKTSAVWLITEESFTWAPWGMFLVFVDTAANVETFMSKLFGSFEDIPSVASTINDTTFENQM